MFLIFQVSQELNGAVRLLIALRMFFLGHLHVISLFKIVTHVVGTTSTAVDSSKFSVNSTTDQRN